MKLYATHINHRLKLSLFSDEKSKTSALLHVSAAGTSLQRPDIEAIAISLYIHLYP